MKTWIKTSLVATLAASTLLAGAAVAGHGHGGGPGWGGHGATPEQVRAHFTRHAEQRLARLELALALTPEQKPAWANFKKAVASRAETALKEMEGRWKAGQPGTALEKLQRAEEASKQRARFLADTRKDVEAFYGKLSDAQKTVFDAEADRLLSPRGHASHRRDDGKGGRRGRG